MLPIVTEEYYEYKMLEFSFEKTNHFDDDLIVSDTDFSTTIHIRVINVRYENKCLWRVEYGFVLVTTG